MGLMLLITQMSNRSVLKLYEPATWSSLHRSDKASSAARLMI